ncbi:MAG: pilin [Kangiellaceae bacterium]|nr:pilin [Kangiellaceae bacterium]
MKNLLVFTVLAVAIGSGIYYAVNQSPDVLAQSFFRTILKEVSPELLKYEKDLASAGTMKSETKQLSFNFIHPDGNQERVTLSLSVKESQLLLAIGDTASLLSGETIILEPSREEGTTVWKCINGSVLVRIRPKNCRLGLGELRTEMLKF